MSRTVDDAIPIYNYTNILSSALKFLFPTKDEKEDILVLFYIQHGPPASTP